MCSQHCSGELFARMEVCGPALSSVLVSILVAPELLKCS